MKITFISDTHNKHRELDGLLLGGDLLVHCGDISSTGKLTEVGNFLSWFNGLDRYKHKIFIAGNHDFAFQKYDWDEDVIGELFEFNPNVTYLENTSVIIDGIKFYGSPWTPEFNNWAFNATLEELADMWKDIPDDTDVLITHGPPKGILDVTREGLHVGDPELTQALIRVRPKVHAFGHIHEACGTYMFENGDVCINASSANRNYQIVNKPITINI